MDPHRVRAVARRIVAQFRHDRRTLGLLFGAPMLIMTLVWALWGTTSTQRYRVIVATDGPTLAAVADALRRGDTLDVTTAAKEDAMAELAAGRADAVISTRVGFVSTEVVVTIEGSDPFRNGGVLQAIQAAILTAARDGPAQAGIPTVQVEYLHGGADLSLLDYLAPLLIGFFAFFFTFLLSTVSFLRERTTGTLERLLASPLRRAELVVGYLVGFGVFALLQAAVIVGFTLFVLRVRYEGNIATIFLIEGILAIVAVSIGLFVSAFARTELQAVQFIPVVIVPQAFLAGLFVPVDQLSDVLRPLSAVMPLTYAMDALRAVMIKGVALSDAAVLRDVAILGLFAVVTIAGAIASIRREVA